MPVQEQNPEPSNPLGMDGIEFIEFATSQPQALGAVLQTMGFMPVARHRSREVTALPAGPMNLIVNAHADALPGMSAPVATPTFPRIAFAYAMPITHGAARLDLGAWEMPARASAMELNIPGIHGVGDSLLYFVDRYRDFSIYDRRLCRAARCGQTSAGTCAHAFFGVVQPSATIGARMDRFLYAASRLRVLPGGQYFGIMPKGTLLESPCHKFYMQLLEPPPGSEDIKWEERLLRIGLGAPDVRAAVCRASSARYRVCRSRPDPAERQGRANPDLSGGITFELVRSHVEATPQRSLAASDEHRSVRHGHDYAGRTAGSKTARGARRRLHPDHAASARYRRASRWRVGRHRCGPAKRPARHRVPGAARLRGPVRTSARVQDRHRAGHADHVPRARLESTAGLSTTSTHATNDRDACVRDLAKLSMLAVPFDIRIAFEALSWGRHVNEMPQAWDLVQRANRSNLGLAVDSYHMIAAKTPLDALDENRTRKDPVCAARGFHVAGSSLP
jgi:4-hydroxyphenylpyruvate dioxygenase